MRSRCVGCHGKSKHIWWSTNDWMASRSTWGLDRGGPLWWRNSVSMKEEGERPRLCMRGARVRERHQAPWGPEQPYRLPERQEHWAWLFPGLSLLCVASEGLLQPQRISIWHRPASSWEQTEIRTAGRQDEGKRVKRGLGCIREVSRCCGNW